MPIAHGIGVISTVGYVGTDLETNFRRGVGNDAWCDAAAPQYNIGYDPAALGRAVTTFNGSAAVGLIVTVGGLASAIAALSVSTKPFISLIGGTITGTFPGTISGHFYGGITLHTFADNNARFTYLNSTKRFNAAQICLLSNPNSSMATVETSLAYWPSPPRGRVLTARNDGEIASAFTDFRNDNALQAMIVSADPLFQDDKDNLIGYANNSGKYVCYPLQTYANTGSGATHQPNPHHHTKHGPLLATEYYNLGVKANWVITHDRASTLDSANSQVHDG
jgi:hypothetical protein